MSLKPSFSYTYQVHLDLGPAGNGSSAQASFPKNESTSSVPDLPIYLSR